MCTSKTLSVKYILLPQESRKTWLCWESQSYKLLRIFFLLYHNFIGVDHIRLGRLTIKVQWIFKWRQGNHWNKGLFVEKVSNGQQCGNTSKDQNNHQAGAGTTLKIIISRRSWKPSEYTELTIQTVNWNKLETFLFLDIYLDVYLYETVYV